MESIKDEVAIVGIGCTRFGERWDASLDDLVIEAAYAAYEDAGVSTPGISRLAGMGASPNQWLASAAPI